VASSNLFVVMESEEFFIDASNFRIADEAIAASPLTASYFCG
jgi:hypothetical protein